MGESTIHRAGRARASLAARVRASPATFVLASLALWFVPACGAPGPRAIPVTSTAYDEIPPFASPEFRAAREALARGDVHGARAAFQRLHDAHPQNVMLGTWVQECELRAARADRRDEARALGELARRFAEEATARPSAANCVLAARLAPTPAEAETWLARAAESDPDCAWVPYGRAYLAARTSNWTEARAQLERARALDPGHVWSWWLDAWIATRTSSLDDAASLLEGFVRRASADPRVDPRLVADARLDLALVWTLRGDASEARALVGEVDPSDVDAARRLGALAAIEQALGDLQAALAAAREASTAAPDDLLPAIQEALLCDEWLGDPVRAEAAWTSVLEKARHSPQVTSVLERTRATIRLERFAARRAGATPSRGDEP